ncbi:hypothetical protein [Actinomadura parmotrematis]|uniref:ATP/GTP-binding protein n=1 Tax=Actinomadura parmotrematis TaxID=2864039 RepID=A0ABS7FM43_9ACTN|nr:hypothetical protein [Actinomadura parmotrematis]MBW8481441.1 hypothetical protein [Actinomadura parmotrematis]
MHSTLRRTMPSIVRRSAAVASIVLIPALFTFSANAAPCAALNCSVESGGGSTSGGGGGTGGGSGGGGGGTGTLDGSNGALLPILNQDDPPPAPAAPATIDLAMQARSSAQLPLPQVHTSPQGKTYVRLRTSLWVDGFVQVETPPITVGAQTVQAVATPKSVLWQLGETSITCNSGGSKSGGCSYVYKRSSAKEPSGTYKITASITWAVSWTCQGADCDAAGGVLDDLTAISAQTPLVVSEIQTNNGN